MKEKYTKIESRLIFVDENYTNGWSLNNIFSVKPLKKPAYRYLNQDAHLHCILIYINYMEPIVLIWLR